MKPTRLYVKKREVQSVLRAITKQQTRANRFTNVFVCPYKGRKYDPAETAVIVIC